MIVNGEKMSKSLGNFFTIRELLADAPGEALRLTLLGTHYRQPLDFTRAGLAQSKATLDRWYGALNKVKDVKAETFPPPLRSRTPCWTISTRHWPSRIFMNA